MTSKDALYPIIRKVERNEEFDPVYQTRIEVKRSILSRDYYLVSHNNTLRGTANSQITMPVRAHEKDWNLILAIKYTATTASGIPERIAQKIVDVLGGEHPQSKLEQRIKDLLGEFVSNEGGPAEFISRFDKLNGNLAREIQRRIEEGVGLNLRLNIRPTVEGRSFEKNKKIEKELRFQVQDHLDALTAKLSLDLDAQAGVWAFVFHNSLDQLANDVAATAESFLRKSSLQKIRFETEDLRRKLRDELESLVNRYGRTVSRLGFDCRVPVSDSVEQTHRITDEKIDFPNLIEYPEPVTAQCELQLELERLGTYIEHKSPNLKEWVTRTVREAILKKLLDVPYIDLFLGQGGTGKDQSGFGFFDRKMKETEKLVCEQAAAIGYRVSTIFIRTNLQFDELRRGFRISILDEEYQTSVPKYPAGLDVEILARITNEEVIRQLFRQDVDIKKIIKSTIREEIRQRIRQMSPEKYYTQFEHSDDIGNASVLDGLASLIKESMIRNYKATDISVTCTQRLTDLAELFDQLRKDQRRIDLEDARSGLKFEVEFHVEALQKLNWEKFQSRRPTAEMVQRNVELFIKQRLSSIGRERLQQAPDTALRDHLNTVVGLQDVPAELGVIVTIVYFSRKITEGEKGLLGEIDEGIQRRLATGKKVDEISRATLEMTLDELQHQLSIALKGGDDGEIDRINKRIKETKKAFAEEEMNPVSEVLEKAAQKEIRNLNNLTGGANSKYILPENKRRPKARAAALTAGSTGKGPEQKENFD
ncbi:MAG TPA: hypothetical protein VG759_23260 [Candidatus Angelobacter sp.]|jgi:hypothetical protein|nr:hypothetical protein [Candidatus Angelobacter sp.]